MRLADYSKRLLAIAETLHRWLGVLAVLDDARREKVALYAEEIAATLARAAAAMAKLSAEPQDAPTFLQAMRELGRIAGYVETIVSVLKHHLDGRKLAGLKRRLQQLGDPAPAEGAVPEPRTIRIERLVAAEGYFRALADGLRT